MSVITAPSADQAVPVKFSQTRSSAPWTSVTGSMAPPPASGSSPYQGPTAGPLPAFAPAS